MAKIFAPNKEYAGVSAGVSFHGGEAHTDDPHLISWFRNHGYIVEEASETPSDASEIENGTDGQETPPGLSEGTGDGKSGPESMEAAGAEEQETVSEQKEPAAAVAPAQKRSRKKEA